MFTPQEIQEQTFSKAVFGGYDMQQVDDFLEPLTEDYIMLYKENSVLKSKMKVLVEKLEEYRGQEAAMKQQMAQAQAQCDRMIAEAQSRSATIVAGAETTLRSQSDDLKKELAEEQTRLDDAKRTALNFIDVIEQDIKGHLELLEKLKAMDLHVEEKPKQPRSNLASMGIYVFSWRKLRAYLIEDEGDETSSNDFGKNIIPKMLQNGEKMSAYRFSGYWKDVGTLDSLWDANMDMLATGSGLDLLEKDWPIYGRSTSAPPAYLGKRAHVEHSVIARGCTVEGEAENSVLSERCTVEEGASVQYSILMPGAVVKKDARVSYAIIGENGVVGEHAFVGAPPEAVPPEQWGITVLGPGAAVADDYVLPANRMRSVDGKETVR